ncbi:MAG TPA: chemotaxis response regulator protein-glutamate methylesterase [Anaerolinea thermolimosa]|uniref:Protein-glutamate methylesterase/protein-glutamine glutaminase n=1 Tax=Anaerolinea thermolimosa TaxID=229919 RepID=A0A3D1JCH7_9CHLR|nr:chemotaxis response regulator protein-glutamate methylesterase [Anaerolinea thermolimosa]GAP07892.1 chemotaxis response regulator containing a CheY-like receiver domain and a methylesterase domain [Anaerolinea thermolimosa]HCE16291.1 chemotaxis response regulator protein-glutamate methylesterase [Anaerolinea thermolimosa]
MAVPVQPSLPRPVRVLVVDDSAFMRYSISQYLNERPDLQVVGAARDGREALDLIPRLDPDVVTLDVEMPRLDGLSTLREIMQRFPRPVVMLSSMTREGAAETIQALTLGAVDFVTKPTSNVNIRSVLDEAAQKILRAASAHIRPVSLLARKPPAPVVEAAPKGGGRPLKHHEPVVLIGTSTGGPRALHEVVPALPADLPAAVVIVQHMPAGFTHSLAERLDSLSKLKVKEAQPGDSLLVGQALLAPGGFHMLFDENLQVTLNQNPTVHGVRPAVDVTLISLIQRLGRSVIAVILTGMGSDGTNGATLLHSMGGRVIAEHESTSVVWGMPRSVVEAGAADFILPLPEVASRIEQLVQESRNG